METFEVVVCADCQVHWRADIEPPKCSRYDHIHRRVQLHRHRDVVVLPDGTSVTATSFNADDPYARDQSPDYGLYLDRHWQPPWPHEHLDWQDFDVPESRAPVIAALRSVLAKAHAGQCVEIG